jgi:hypothetical protein
LREVESPAEDGVHRGWEFGAKRELVAAKRRDPDTGLEEIRYVVDRNAAAECDRPDLIPGVCPRAKERRTRPGW